MSEIKKLINKVNKVVGYHRHGNPIPKQALDDLSNIQIDAEKELETLEQKITTFEQQVKNLEKELKKRDDILGNDYKKSCDQAKKITELEQQLAKYECEHEKGLTDYCEPCGRINSN